jgi:hypothetical protein
MKPVIPLDSMPPARGSAPFLSSLALASLLLVLSHSISAARSQSTVAIIPGQTRVENGQLLSAAWGVSPHSIYLIRDGQQRGKEVVRREAGTIYRTQLSPDARLLAYALEEQGPSRAHAQPVAIQSVIITSSDGVQRDSVSNGARVSWSGMRFAWNERGSRLAVLLGGEGGGRQAQDDSVVVWNGRVRGRETFKIRPGAWEIGWASDDTVLISHYDGVDAIALPSGAMSRSWHRASDLSQDHQYSLVWTDQGRSLRVCEDAPAVEVTYGIMQVVGTAAHLGRARWIREEACGHVLAVTSCDSALSSEGPLGSPCQVSFLEVAGLRRIFQVPGQLV